MLSFFKYLFKTLKNLSQIFSLINTYEILINGWSHELILQTQTRRRAIVINN
jgi:hypothetical protein